MKKIMLAICPILLALSVPTAFAEMEHHSMEKNANPMTEEYIVAMDNMHQPMMEGIMAENPDVAFVKGMIPHHQGAVSMAIIELKYGQDPEIRALAEEVIKAQEKEIEFMQMWLEKNDK